MRAIRLPSDEWAEAGLARAAVMARDNVIRVLDRMVAEGDLHERHAIDIGHRVLCGNAQGIFLSQRR